MKQSTSYLSGTWLMTHSTNLIFGVVVREGSSDWFAQLQAAAMPPVVGWWKTIVWDRCVDPLNRGWLVLVLRQQIQ
ncbi:hypothetical protein SCP_1602420 [Sparassis crispa]|uniref:Uncharacterized protein n=1 Tax=Sparassis crispa TaxID=139825 RepID=A0A401H5B8_9APHY|nr:hypothetical protein SCP_1602420 [Sparassis crispa]GBE89579.1 hypothetical protein SCP_1602420 [Sparassis crispa]